MANFILTLILMTGAKLPVTQIIDCTADSMRGSANISVSPETLMVDFADRTSVRLNVRAKMTSGAGKKARVIVDFTEGEMSFQDKYGCLSDVRFSKASKDFMAMKKIKCVRRGAAACRPNSTNNKLPASN